MRKAWVALTFVLVLAAGIAKAMTQEEVPFRDCTSFKCHHCNTTIYHCENGAAHVWRK